MEGTNFLPSLLKGFTAKESTAISWLMVINHLTDGSLLELTQRYRDTGDWRWKSRLLSITPACQLNGTGKEAADVVGLTGVAMADFDHIAPTRIEEVRQQVNADPHTFLSYVTVSGDGLRVLYRYEGTDYATAFLTGNCYYADLIGHPFDEKCSNVNRLSALCYDTQAYFNESAVAFKISKNSNNDLNAPKASDNLTDPVAYAIRTVERHGETYIRGNRHTYLMKCVSMMNRLGVSQQEAEQWAQAFDLGEREIRTLVKSVYSLYAAQHGTYTMPELTKTKTENFADAKPNFAGAKFGVAQHSSSKLGSAFAPSNFQTFNFLDTSHAHTRVSKFHPFPDYEFPKRIMQTLECTDSKAQRDMMLLAVITVLGAMIGRLLRFKYSHRFWYPALQTFAVGTAASGKSGITLARRLSDPLVKRLERIYDQAKRQYEKAKAAYDCAGKEKANMEVPEPPKMKLFQLAGNTTASAVIEHLDENDGHALMCESEADTISQMTNTESGGSWSDILRKAHDHDQILMTRRTNRERRKVENPCLSVLISGTPAQVKPLINSAENGQFSREIFLQLPAIDEFIDQFDDEETDFDSRFYKWGEDWLQELDRLKGEVSCIELKLTAQQREEFNAQFSQLFHHAASTQADHHMKSSVAREAINVLRMMSVVALLRALETGAGLNVPADVPKENVQDGVNSRYDLSVTDDDFRAVVALAEPLYRNACDVLALLPSTEFVRQQQSPMEQFAASLPLRFSRAEAIETGAQMGLAKATVDTYINRLKAQRQLQNVERGVYAFTNAVGSRVCVCKNTPESLKV